MEQTTLHVELKLDIFLTKDGDGYIAYNPFLDISAIGNTREDAILCWRETMMLYYDIVKNNGVTENKLIT